MPLWPSYWAICQVYNVHLCFLVRKKHIHILILKHWVAVGFKLLSIICFWWVLQSLLLEVSSENSVLCPPTCLGICLLNKCLLHLMQGDYLHAPVICYLQTSTMLIILGCLWLFWTNYSFLLENSLHHLTSCTSFIFQCQCVKIYIPKVLAFAAEVVAKCQGLLQQL